MAISLPDPRSGLSRRSQLLRVSVPLMFLGVMCPSSTAAQAASRTGPVVPGYGPVFDVPSPDLPVETASDHWVVFDVSSSPDDPALRNARLETAARFLNMHGRAGVPRERMRVALVVHGGAGKDLLLNAAYQERFGTKNPNLEMLEELSMAGVEIYLCGQTAAARDLPSDQLADPVRIALSAMTALVALQGKGYRLVAF